jgi:hypothetical protein
MRNYHSPPPQHDFVRHTQSRTSSPKPNLGHHHRCPTHFIPQQPTPTHHTVVHSVIPFSFLGVSFHFVFLAQSRTRAVTRSVQTVKCLNLSLSCFPLSLSSRFSVFPFVPFRLSCTVTHACCNAYNLNSEVLEPLTPVLPTLALKPFFGVSVSFRFGFLAQSRTRAVMHIV